MKLTPNDTDSPSASDRRRPLCVRGRVLVAESSPTARAGVRKIFAAQGFTVVECTSGSDVIGLAKQHVPDVVFLDVAMKRVDAGECIRILERFPGTRSVVVVLTCPPDIDAGRLARLEASGALLVMVKPLTSEGLLHAFRQALAESHERKTRFEAPARRKAPATRHVPGNNALLVRRLLCPFHETPVPVDRYVLRTGKIQTDTNFFDLPVYKKPVAGADYVDYQLLNVAACPRCLFASNNPAYFTDPAGHKDKSHAHTAAARAAVAAATGERLLLAGTLPPDFFTHERSLAAAMLGYELAIHAGKTLHAANPHAMTLELLRLGNYHLRLAHLHAAAGSGDDIRAQHFASAYEWLQRAFTVLESAHLYKATYQLVALGLSFGEDRMAYQYLTRLSELEREPQKKGEDRGALDRYLARSRRAWEDRDDVRFPWVTLPDASSGTDTARAA